MPPRLLVGAVFGATPLAERFERAGHTVRPLDIHDDPGAVAHVDLVLLDGPSADIRAACEKIRAGGGAVTREPGPVKGGTTVIAFVTDPDGYVYDFMWMDPAAAEQGPAAFEAA